MAVKIHRRGGERGEGGWGVENPAVFCPPRADDRVSTERGRGREEGSDICSGAVKKKKKKKEEM